ncbi:MAG: YifB family Mg chelatase-like AAA ATPase [Planctomycetota bacterium]
MLSRVHSALLVGIDAHPCEVEVDLDPSGLDQQGVVGLPDAAVRESLQRVRAALQNAGYPFPVGKTLINLAPADVRKEGPMYDLPIAAGLLLAQQVIGAGAASGGLDPRTTVLAGELSLDGRVRPIRGALSIADRARSDGMRSVIVPSDNAPEAAVVEGIDVFGVSTIAEVVGLMGGELEPEPMPPADVASLVTQAEPEVDFADVKGQEGAKRALMIAAAGAHNLLMLGPAGSGKTMMARALPGILPPLSPGEAIEVTRVHSAATQAGGGPGLVTTRPVRTPHHTASSAAIVGGGAVPRPGEVSLAHLGVLFLDELPEFPRGVLETLRQPLEDGVVTIARASGTVRFPARFMLVAAMNPTPKGDLPAGEQGRRDMERYLSKLSGPLLDRIDLHVEAPRVAWKELGGPRGGLSTVEMRDSVLRARRVAEGRQGPGRPNASLSGRELDAMSGIDDDATALLGQAIESLGLSARAYDKIRRSSRTIADLAGSTGVTIEHVAEAVQYRLLDRRLSSV